MKLNCILSEESTDLITSWHIHARTHAQKKYNPTEPPRGTF